MANAGSGLSGSIGFGAETSYGVYAPATRWVPWEEEKFAVERKFSQAKGIVGGSLVQQAQQVVLLTQMVKGSLKFPVVNSGMGLLLKSIMGAATGPVQQGTTAAYASTFTIAPTVGDSLSVQIGRPQTSGIITPFNYLGCKATSIEITLESGAVAECAMDFVGQQMTEADTLVTPVYGTPNPIVFSFQGSTLSAGAIGSETAMGNVRKANIKIERKLDEERFYIGGNGLLDEPIEDDFLAITGDLTVDFTDTTDWDAYVNAGEQISIILNLVGQQIATGYNFGLKLAVPVAQIEGSDPNMSGPKIVERQVKFEGLNDNVHQPLTITYTSTDTTL